MEYRSLGKSDLKVSEIGLGTDTFGRSADEKSSVDIVNRVLDLGVNFIDTADVYGNGQSEEFLGKAIKGKRSKVIIATKFGMILTEGPNKEGGPNYKIAEHGGSRQHILKAVEASLKRLNTNYIDLYQMHFPDPTTSLEETFRTLEDLIKAGKVRYIGCSNYAAWQLCDALWISKTKKLPAFISVQPRYNLLDRRIEQELVPCCQAHDIGIIPWFPLAAGFLTGKYHRGQAFPEGTRFASDPEFYTKILLSDAAFDKLEKLEAFASAHGHKVSELAIAWLLGHPWLSTVIIGATKADQVSANVAAAKWKLSADEMQQLNKIA